jgi:hypothetical protein
MPNPPGNGPGPGQVFVGVVVPILVASAGSLLAGIRAVEATIWALASVALTGGLILFLMYFVEYVIRPAYAAARRSPGQSSGTPPERVC